MKRMIRIWSADGEYIDVGFISGVTLVSTRYGWYPSLNYLTVKGELFPSKDCTITPFILPLLEYKPLLLEYHDDRGS